MSFNQAENYSFQQTGFWVMPMLLCGVLTGSSNAYLTDARFIRRARDYEVVQNNKLKNRDHASVISKHGMITDAWYRILNFFSFTENPTRKFFNLAEHIGRNTFTRSLQSDDFSQIVSNEWRKKSCSSKIWAHFWKMKKFRAKKVLIQVLANFELIKKIGEIFRETLNLVRTNFVIFLNFN